MFSNASITTGTTGVNFGSGLFGTRSINTGDTFLTTTGSSNAYSLTNALNINN